MRVDELTTALREEAAAQPHVDDALDEVYGRRNRRRTATGAVLAAVAVVVVAAAVGIGVRSGDDDAVITDETGEVGVAVPGEWERLPDPPLSPRSNTTMVWTGSELIVFGGDEFICPPGADCGYDGPRFSDGAAFDPETRTWRRIADAPVTGGATEVIGDDVYVLSGADFVRYSITEDTWERLPAPPGDEGSYHALVSTGRAVVAYTASHEFSDVPDVIFDIDSGTWDVLASDPLAPSFDRQLVWVDQHLYLFAHDLVDQPGSDGPSLAQVARFDVSSGVWEELPPTEALGVGGVAIGAEIVQPELGGADGGDVNGWDREYPYGGIYDTAVLEWRPLPEAPDDVWSVGVIGRDTVWTGSTGGGGVMLDTETDTWIEVPGITEHEADRRNLVGTDQAVIAYGGEHWDDASDGEVLGDAWILTFTRP